VIVYAKNGKDLARQEISRLEELAAAVGDGGVTT
jgi:hypothetical protein